MQSKASTVPAYLASLDPDRRLAIATVREVIVANLDPQYEEGMSYGMIGYYVPLSIFPQGYHANPSQGLPFAALASQKNYMSLYLMGLYCGCDGSDETARIKWFRTAWAESGKQLRMGKACIRFKKVNELDLPVIGEAVRRVPARLYIEEYLKTRQRQTQRAAPSHVRRSSRR